MKRTVQEMFNQVPEKIQDIIMSIETSESLYEIEKKIWSLQRRKWP